MARKRVNKNLVAFLTVMGIMLTAVVVMIATSLGANRDPEIWADQARKRMKIEDYENAVSLFKRAYLKSEDVKYLVEAAGCYYSLGDTGSLFGVLKTAQSASDLGSPSHVKAVKAYLDYAWDLARPYYYRNLSPDTRSNLLDCALDMQKSDPQNVLGSISEAVARLAMSADEPQQRVEADAALQRAISLDENNPWVVLTRIQQDRQETTERLPKVSGTDEREKVTAEFTQRALALLKSGVDANPTDWTLLSEYVGVLQDQDRPAEARQALDQALVQDPDAAEIHAGLATLLIWQASKERAKLSPEEYAKLLDEASEHSVTATRLSPGLFRAYTTQAQAVLLRGAQEPDAATSSEQYEKALAIYEHALAASAGVHSIDAVRGAGRDQPLLHIQAFQVALQYLTSTGKADEREPRLEWVRKFRKAIEDRYPDDAFTCYVQGLACLAENEATGAIQAFEKANRLGRADTRGRYPALWFQGFGGVLPVHRLATLYRQANEPGRSLSLTDEAIRRYTELQPERLPPFDLCLNRAELLNTLNRPQEALDYIKVLRNDYAAALKDSASGRQRLGTAEAVALSLTKRGGEATTALENPAGAAGLLLQAKLAMVSQDRETAVARLLEALAADDLNAQQALQDLGLLVPLLTEQDQRDTARQALPDLKKRFAGDERVARRLDQYDAVLAYNDPDELDSKLLELIASEPEGSERTRHYFDFYASRQRYAEAQKYLDEMEAANPNDTGVMGDQFTLAMRTKNYERAEQYAGRLAHADDGAGADNAGGAIFRGQLALQRNQAEDAVREYRTAQARLPRSSGLQVQLAQALLAANRVDEAIDALREACDLNPNNFEANALLDDTYYRRISPERRPEDWEKYLEQAARLRPRNSYVVENADRADPQAGIKVREQQRAAEPQDVDNLIRLAQLYANKKVGDLAHAAERLLEAAHLEPGNLDVARAAAQFFGNHGKRAEGEQVLSACLQQQSGPQRVTAQLLLARFYDLLDDTAAAEQAFATARQMALENPEGPGGPNDTLLRVELELVNFYRGLPGRARDTITAARWVLDKLNPKEAKDRPRMQYALQAIIRALLDSKQLGEAEKEINDYIKAFGEDTAVALDQAQLKIAQRQWQDAYAALTKVLEAAPSHSWALLQRGGLATQLGMSREATADLTKARDLTKAAFERLSLDKRAGSAELKLYAAACAELATVYEMEEQYELGESTLREMVDLLYQGSGPEYQAKQRDAVTRLLRLYDRWGRFDKAQELISGFMARYADDPFWPLLLARVRTQQAKRYGAQADAAAKLNNAAEERKYRADAESEYLAAARYYDNAEQLSANQQQPAHLVYVAYELDVLAAAKRTDRALELFRSVAAQTGAEVPAIVHAAMVRVYQTSGQRSQAQGALEKAIVAAYREGGEAVPAVMNFAGDYLPAEAVADVIRGLIDKVNAGSREACLLHNLLATQLLDMHQPAEALKAVEAVLAKAPPNSAERLAAMVARQQALLASGQVDAALASLEEIVRINPNNALVLNNLAYLLADQANRPAEALPYAERARELNGTDPSVLDTLGWVYIRNGRNEQAEAALKEALAQEPDNAAANYHLGVLYQATGRMSAARVALQRALECAANDKNDEIQKKAQEALDGLR